MRAFDFWEVGIVITFIFVELLLRMKETIKHMCIRVIDSE